MDKRLSSIFEKNDFKKYENILTSKLQLLNKDNGGCK